jgi:hypothetical protein
VFALQGTLRNDQIHTLVLGLGKRLSRGKAGAETE